MKKSPRGILRPKSRAKKTVKTLEAPDFLSAITNGVPGGLIVVNSGGGIIYYNVATRNLLRIDTDITHKNISEVLKLKNKSNRAYNIIEKLGKAESTTTHSDLRLLLGPEEFIRLELSISPIRSDSSKPTSPVVGHVISLRDITKAKNLEDERNEFLGFVSHELRAPVAVMEGAISNLQLMNERGSLKKSVLSASLASAYSQVMSLSDIINGLGALSLSEQDDAIASCEVSIKDMLNELYLLYQPRAAKKSLALDLNVNIGNIKIETFRPYLEEIVQNFVTNAIKYTETGGITISAFETENCIVISVADTGIGISKTDQKRIFKKFYRALDPNAKKADGIGLGLYIAAKLSRKIGAEITLESRPGYGSTFSIILPRTK